MMELFYEKKEFFQLKELEKLCQKEKGITSMSVKEVLQSLVDDGMVDTDKIGTSIYYWAFPSKASQNRKRKIDELNLKTEELSKKKIALQESIEKAKCGREESECRTTLLKQLADLREEKEDLSKELQKLRDCDPAVLDEIKRKSETAKEASNRWTDNILSFKSWLKKKFNCEEKTLNKQFEIPEDLDYVE